MVLKSNIVSQHTENWFQYLSQNGFLQLDRLRLFASSQEIDHVEEPVMRSLLLTGRGKAFSIEGNMRRAKLDLDRSLQEIDEHSLDDPSPGADEALAYSHYEQGVFWLKVGESELARRHFAQAARAVRSEDLGLHVRFHRTMLRANADESFRVDQVTQFLEAFRAHEHWIMVVFGLRQLALLQRRRKQFDATEKTLHEAEAITLERNYGFLYDQVANALGYLYLITERGEQACEVFDALIPRTQSNYIRSIALENMALYHQQDSGAEAAIDACVQALENSQKYDVISQIPDECLFIGQRYEKDLDDISSAEYYYQIGQAAAIEQSQMGFPLTGDRLAVYERYTRLLQGKRSAPRTPRPHTAFRSLIGKPWREIQDLFQYNLIIYHMLEEPDATAILDAMDLKATTYYAQKRRLTEAGFDFSVAKPETAQHLDNRIYLDTLQRYIKGLIHRDWKRANKQFETEVIQSLFQHYGYQKARLARELQVSYPTILAKTRPFTEKGFPDR